MEALPVRIPPELTEVRRAVLGRLGTTTWNEALAMAGVPPCAPGAGSRGVDSQDLVTVVVGLQAALGRLPTPGEFEKVAQHRSPWNPVAKCRFGSWGSFVAALPPGFDPESGISEPTPSAAKDRPSAGHIHPGRRSPRFRANRGVNGSRAT